MLRLWFGGHFYRDVFTSDPIMMQVAVEVDYFSVAIRPPKARLSEVSGFVTPFA